MPKEGRLSLKKLRIEGNYLYAIGNGEVSKPLSGTSSLLIGYRYVAKYDLEGRRLWLTKERKKNSIENGNLIMYDMAVNHEGEAYVVGHLNISNRGYIDKYSHSGKLLWHKTFAGWEFYRVMVGKKQNLIVTGSRDRDALIVKFNPKGKIVWTEMYEERYHIPMFIDSVVDSQNNIYTVGDDAYAHAHLFKYDPHGKRLWVTETIIASQGYTKGVSLFIGVDDRLYIAGHGLKIKDHKVKSLATAVYDLEGNIVEERLHRDHDKQKKSDKLITHVNFYKAYQRKDGKYYIVQKSKVLYDDLKYFHILHRDSNGTAIQIIDSHNRAKKIFIVADEPQHPMDYIPLICGNGVITHHVSVVDKGKTLDVEVVFHWTDEEQYQKDVNKTHRVVRISKNQADKVFFKEHKNQITFDENYNNPQPMLYYQKGMKYGFLGNIVVKRTKKSVEYSLKKSKDKKLYDALVFENYSKIRLKCHSLSGYHNLTKIKYKSIGKFDKNLARFELLNGKKGYVDLKGVEYYD